MFIAKKQGLVLWNMVFMTFHILGRIIPTDELIFSEGLKSQARRFNHHGELGSKTLGFNHCKKTKI
jgi:hypothetical protein